MQSITPYLRKVLMADALVSGAAAILMIAGAGILAPVLALPAALLFWAGIALLPFAALLVLVARREHVWRLLLLDIVLVNALWVAASLMILITGMIVPNSLGTLFVVAQAAAVALLGALQFAGLRGAGEAAA